MENENQKNVKGMRLRALNNVAIVAACLLYVLVIYATVQVALRYDELISATDDYIECEKNAALVREGSDYLTEQVRLYAVTMETQYIDSYMEEVNVTKRREKALEELGKYSFSDRSQSYLSTALSNSNKLISKELYSIKLVSIANDYNMKLLPEEVRNVQVTLEDRSLPEDEMLEKAQEMVFDDAYQASKALIMSDIEHFLEGIVEETGQKQKNSVGSLESMISQQRWYISALFILNILTFIMIIVLVIRPVQIYIECIKEGRLMKIVGSREFRYLALTYNEIFEANSANQALLRHKADHDPLTGIANRGTFDRLRDLLKTSKSSVALLLIDVDEFKQINDSYGHATGDMVLKKVAKLLQDQFRSNDYPARIGGDEFAVIMTDITPSLRFVIENKMDSINQVLQNPDDGLPKVSLSVGVAFSEAGMADELYKNTDKALYFVKRHGRNGCKFYEDLPQSTDN